MVAPLSIGWTSLIRYPTIVESALNVNSIGTHFLLLRCNGKTTPATIDTGYLGEVDIGYSETGYPTLATSRVLPIHDRLNSPADRLNVKEKFPSVYFNLWGTFT